MHDRDEADDGGRADTEDEPGEDRAESSRLASPRRPLLKAAPAVPFVPPLGQRGPGKSGDDGRGRGRDADPPVDRLEEGDTAAFSDVVRFPRQYRIEVTTTGDGDAATTMTGRVDGGDQFVRTEYPGGATESYVVDGTLYVVTDEECLRYSDLTTDGDRQPRPPRGRPRRLTDPRIEVTATTEVDGRDTLVLEVIEWPHDLPPAAEHARRDHANGHGVEWQRRQRDVTYHVDVQTGYLRRLVTAEATVDYHAWGDVDPVRPPDVACHEGRLPTT